MIKILEFAPRDPLYPPALRARLGAAQAPHIAAAGRLEHLSDRLVGLFCSAKCPGNLILEAYDLARRLRDAGVTVIGGFHSPMEKECLALLLRGRQPIVICPARGLQRMRLPTKWKDPLEAGRLLLLSPFSERDRRVTAELAERRNRFVAALADEVFVVHAAPGGKTEQFCRDLLAQRKRLLTFDCEENRSLVEFGAVGATEYP